MTAGAGFAEDAIALGTDTFATGGAGIAFAGTRAAFTGAAFAGLETAGFSADFTGAFAIILDGVFAIVFNAAFATGLRAGFAALADTFGFTVFCATFDEVFFGAADFEVVDFVIAFFATVLLGLDTADAGFASFVFFTILVAAARYLARPFFFAFGANFFVITSFSECKLYG